jgi:hypothetical protein
MLIREEWVQAAVDYLREHSSDAAAAKGETIRADYQRTKIRAKLMLQAEGPVELRKAYAESHKEYEAACERCAKAEEAAEWHRNERNKSEMIIEAWRTQESSSRGLRKIA